MPKPHPTHNQKTSRAEPLIRKDTQLATALGQQTFSGKGTRNIATPLGLGPTLPLISNHNIRPLAPLAQIHKDKGGNYLLRQAGARLAASTQPAPFHDLSQQLAKQQEESSPLKLQILDLRRKIYSTEHKLQEESRAKNHLEQLSKAYAEQIRNLRQLNQNLNQQITGLGQLSATKAQEPIPGLREEEQTKKIEGLQKQFDDLNRQIARLRNEAGQKQSELDTLLRENKGLLKESHSLQSGYQALLAIKNNLQAALKNTQAELSEKEARGVTEEALGGLREQINLLQRKIRDQENKIRQLGPLRQNYSALLKERQALEAHLAQLEKAILSKQSTQEKLSAQLSQKEKELQRTKKELAEFHRKQQAQQQLIGQQQSSLKQLLEDRKRLSAFIQELTTKLQSARSQLALMTPAPKKYLQKQPREITVEEPPSPITTKAKPAKKKTKQTPLLTHTPNAINGFVRGGQDHLVAEAIVIIKDAEGNPLRATRTNELGQFVLSTPLPNGKYLIDASHPKEKFDILEITLNGNILPPVEVKAQ